MAIRKIFQKAAMQIYMNSRHFLFFESHCERKKNSVSYESILQKVIPFKLFISKYFIPHEKYISHWQ